MKWLALLFFLLPASASALPLMGVDDIKDKDPVLKPEEARKLDKAIITYYQSPSVEKVNTVLDMINTSDVLRKKTAWPTIVGFLTVVFANNKNHVFGWMSRNDYNTNAQEAIINALLHAKLKESAMVFAQAHQWDAEDMQKLRMTQDTVELKHLTIILPGHIDTLWGAFFASGDIVYLNQIIDTVFKYDVPYSEEVPAPVLDYDVPGENRALAEKSLKIYARALPEVRAAVRQRADSETDEKKKAKLKSILPAQQ